MLRCVQLAPLIWIVTLINILVLSLAPERETGCGISHCQIFLPADFFPFSYFFPDDGRNCAWLI